jgi:ATP-dependent RNA helicase DHX29
VYSTSQAASEDSIIEDWELWGDPREIERRQAERAFKSQTPEQQRASLAQEWVQAREWAAAAKASGDKTGQKSAGQLIGMLKGEMGKLGLSEAEAAELVAVARAEAGVGGDSGGGGGGGQQNGQKDNGGELAVEQQLPGRYVDEEEEVVQEGESAGERSGQEEGVVEEEEGGREGGGGRSGDWEAGRLFEDNEQQQQQEEEEEQEEGKEDARKGVAGNGGPVAITSAAPSGGDAEGVPWMGDLFDGECRALKNVPECYLLMQLDIF